MKDYDVLYRPRPAWFVPGREGPYPGDYAGFIIAVKPAGKPYSPADLGKDREIVRLPLSDADAGRAGSHNLKVVKGILSGWDLQPVTWADRWGELAQDLAHLEGKVRARELAELAGDESQLDAMEADHREAMSEISAAVAALPEVETHTGAGLYIVDDDGAVHNDTEAGTVYGAPYSTITLGTGGLTIDAEIGKVVTFGITTNQYSIVDNTATTVVVIGDATGEGGGDNITIAPYTTIQSAIDRLWADQGNAEYTLEQVIRVHAGTYAEAVAINTMKPRSRYRFRLINATGEAPVIDVTGKAYAIWTAGAMYAIEFGGFTISGAAVACAYILYYSQYSTPYLHDLTITATGQSTAIFEAIARTASVGIIERCDCSSTDSGSVFYAPYGGLVIRRCKFKGYDRFVSQGPSIMLVESCIFDDIGSEVFRAGATAYAGMWRVYNCDFYNIGTLTSVADAPASLHLVNCILQDVGLIIKEAYTDTKIGNLDYRFDRNCYHQVTKYLDSQTDPDVTTFAAWQALGYDANTLEADPLMTDPAAGDFTLQGSSPCLGAGQGMGVETDYSGDALDQFNPPIGAEGSGPCIPRGVAVDMSRAPAYYRL